MTAAPARHPALGAPTAAWTYRDGDGADVFAVLRFDPPGARKEYRPFDLKARRWKYPPSPLPLYRLPELKAEAGRAILVEGEKCAEALRALGYLATTTAGGANGALKTDWTLLKGRDVTIWPDADGPGKRYAESAARALAKAGAGNVAVVRVDAASLHAAWGEGDDPEGFRRSIGGGPDAEPGWDADDAIAGGWTRLHVDRLLSAAIPVSVNGAAPPALRNVTAYIGSPTLHRDAADAAGLHRPYIGEADDGGGSVHPRSSIPNGYLLTDRSVFHVSADEERVLVCDRLVAVALTRDAEGESWGVLVEFSDPDGQPKQLAIPYEALAGDPGAVCGLLMNQGLGVQATRSGKQHLVAYLAQCRPDARVLCVARVGWHGDAYVLPGATFAPFDRPDIALHTGGHLDHAFRAQGTLQEWQDRIARYCPGNSRLAFAVSAAFAPPLLRLLDLEGGGFHFLGQSSVGKTTALRVAGSVWGGGGGNGNGYLRNWRATANGLEATAAAHCDALLCLDELGQVNERDVGHVAYMLANGEGKSRARKDGSGRAPARWVLLFLSTGEQSIADKLREAGRAVHAGQETRLVDVPADAGRRLGLFETLHGFADASTLAGHLLKASASLYGAPIREYLWHLVRHREAVRDRANALARVFVQRVAPAGSDGQVIRVAQRFALVAAAGEAARAAGILPWSEGEAVRAAEACFTAWLDHRGGAASGEEIAAVHAARSFIQRHGDSRFPWVDAEDRQERPTPNRAGFRRMDGQRVQYLMFRESFAELCGSLSPKAVAAALKRRDLLVTDTQGKSTLPARLPGYEKTIRVYCLSGAILGEADE